MSEMVERVALAVAKGEIHGPNFDPFESPDTFAFCQRIARTAIAAMREPTGAIMTDTVTLTVSKEKVSHLLEETEGWVGDLLLRMKEDTTLDLWAEVECLNDMREMLGGRRIEEQGPLTRDEFEGRYVSAHEEIPY